MRLCICTRAELLIVSSGEWMEGSKESKKNEISVQSVYVLVLDVTVSHGLHCISNLTLALYSYPDSLELPAM